MSWVGGEVAPAALAQARRPGHPRRRAGAGAVPSTRRARLRRLRRLRARNGSAAPTARASSGSTRPSRDDRDAGHPGYLSFTDLGRRLEGRPPQTTLARNDTPSLPREAVGAVAGFGTSLLEAFGWTRVPARAAALARRLADPLPRARPDRGAARPDRPLVAWEDAFAEELAPGSAAAGRCGAAPSGPPVPARVGWRVERRVRPGAPARRHRGVGPRPTPRLGRRPHDSRARAQHHRLRCDDWQVSAGRRRRSSSGCCCSSRWSSRRSWPPTRPRPSARRPPT